MIRGPPRSTLFPDAPLFGSADARMGPMRLRLRSITLLLLLLVGYVETHAVTVKKGSKRGRVHTRLSSQAGAPNAPVPDGRTSELHSPGHLVRRLLLDERDRT